jgi:hypothetical protein
MGGAKPIEHMEDMSNAYQISVGRTERKRSLGSSYHRGRIIFFFISWYRQSSLFRLQKLYM